MFAFRDERDWRQFNGLKDEALPLLIEAGVLAEHLRWHDDEALRARTMLKNERVRLCRRAGTSGLATNSDVWRGDGSASAAVGGTSDRYVGDPAPVAMPCVFEDAVVRHDRRRSTVGKLLRWSNDLVRMGGWSS